MKFLVSAAGGLLLMAGACAGTNGDWTDANMAEEQALVGASAGDNLPRGAETRVDGRTNSTNSASSPDTDDDDRDDTTPTPNDVGH